MREPQQAATMAWRPANVRLDSPQDDGHNRAHDSRRQRGDHAALIQDHPQDNAKDREDAARKATTTPGSPSLCAGTVIKKFRTPEASRRSPRRF